jgi:hypothetical protein
MESCHFTAKANGSIQLPKELNNKNDPIIFNLSDQNSNIRNQVMISGDQIINLEDQLQISKKETSKQKRKTFFYKTTTVGAAIIALIIAVK